MESNWDRAISSVLWWEGGSAVRVEEPGGAVNRGVSLQTYREDHPGATIQDLLAMTDDEAKEIYRRRYAKAIGFDELPAGLDVVMLHLSIMFGVVGAQKLLNACLASKYWEEKSPTEKAASLTVRAMQTKMKAKSIAKFGSGWGDRLVAIYEIAGELAHGVRA